MCVNLCASEIFYDINIINIIIRLNSFTNFFTIYSYNLDYDTESKLHRCAKQNYAYITNKHLH